MKINTESVQLNTTSTSRSLSSWYHEIFYEKADPRIRDRWLMGDPIQLICIYTFYVIFIKYILPWIMRDRKPVNIDKAAIVLNSALLLSCIYFVCEAFPHWVFEFSWRCQPIDWSESEIAMKVRIKNIVVNIIWFNVQIKKTEMKVK